MACRDMSLACPHTTWQIKSTNLSIIRSNVRRNTVVYDAVNSRPDGVCRCAHRRRSRSLPAHGAATRPYRPTPYRPAPARRPHPLPRHRAPSPRSSAPPLLPRPPHPPARRTIHHAKCRRTNHRHHRPTLIIVLIHHPSPRRRHHYRRHPPHDDRPWRPLHLLPPLARRPRPPARPPHHRHRRPIPRRHRPSPPPPPRHPPRHQHPPPPRPRHRLHPPLLLHRNHRRQPKVMKTSVFKPQQNENYAMNHLIQTDKHRSQQLPIFQKFLRLLQSPLPPPY